MARKLLKRERAKRDIIELTVYIAQDDRNAAERFIEAIEQAFQLLLEMPGAGASRAYLAPSVSDIRMWPVQGFENYLVFYRETRDGIEIVRVLHAARDIDALFRDDPQ